MMKNKLGRVFKACGLLLFAFLVNACQGVPLLDPKGPVGMEEKNLILISVGLGLIVILPLFALVIWFSIRYRESNKKATYKPHWEGSWKVEAVIWLVPVAIIVVLSILTVVTTIKLDPYRPIASTEKPVRVQVVSLDWNWLFIYPDYGVASVNKLVIPAGAPVTFDLTSATVMTSFFIPDLGSQIYAMAGMVTHLNLLADHPGTYSGQNMEFSGSGYASMHFVTDAVTNEQFDAWTRDAKSSQATLSLDEFNKMNTPQSDIPVTTFASVEPNLFGHIVGQFMGWQGENAMRMPDNSMKKESDNLNSMKMTDDETANDSAMTSMKQSVKTIDQGSSAMPMTNQN